MEPIKINTTFWNEISEYKIEIPSYQRDYAQGRRDNGQIDNIRKVFVKELFQALRDGGMCHLGLVYGSFDEGKKVFVAVDGQQRLTTVFLLHWYVAWVEGCLNSNKEILEKFSWHTRSYSSQFVSLLMSLDTSEKDVLFAIKESKDYFPIWEKDPTVKGMMTMLAAIEKEYKAKDGLLKSKIFSYECNIRYDILKLEKDSDARTYLKMNSRGRSLTTYENFKSKFIDKYGKIDGELSKKVDNLWLNFMIKISQGNEDGNGFDAIDIYYMNFINEYCYLQMKMKEYCYLQMKKKEDGNHADDSFQFFIEAKIRENWTDVPYISFDNYIKVFGENGENVKAFKDFFDWICVNYDYIKEIDEKVRFDGSKFFLDEIIISKNPHFSHRVKLFSLIKFAKLIGYDRIEKNNDLYQKWSRFFRNLIANTSITKSNIGRICYSIQKLENENVDIYTIEKNDFEGFNSVQIDEEIEKIKKIKKEESSWESRLDEMEKYAFFKGMIRFLFLDENGVPEWDDFEKKKGNAMKYFDKNGIIEDYKIGLTRALVIQCDDWDKQLYDKQIFNPNNVTWGRILGSDAWRKPIHYLLAEKLDAIEATKENKNKMAKEYITPILDKLPIEKMEPEGRFRWNGRLAYYKPYGRTAITFDWDDFKRNAILTKLYDAGDVETKQRIDKTSFYNGWNIDFEYKEKQSHFRWAWNNYIYLMADGNVKQERDSSSNKEEERYFCFNVGELTKEEHGDMIECIKDKLNELLNAYYESRKNM